MSQTSEELLEGVCVGTTEEVVGKCDRMIAEYRTYMDSVNLLIQTIGEMEKIHPLPYTSPVRTDRANVVKPIWTRLCEKRDQCQAMIKCLTLIRNKSLAVQADLMMMSKSDE